MSIVGMDAFKEVVQQFEDNYPELLKRTYVINGKGLVVTVDGFLEIPLHSITGVTKLGFIYTRK